MQMKNSVIKNYILSPEKYIIKDNVKRKTGKISIYNLPSQQSKDSFCLILLKK